MRNRRAYFKDRARIYLFEIILRLKCHFNHTFIHKSLLGHRKRLLTSRLLQNRQLSNCRPKDRANCAQKKMSSLGILDQILLHIILFFIHLDYHSCFLLVFIRNYFCNILNIQFLVFHYILSKIFLNLTFRCQFLLTLIYILIFFQNCIIICYFNYYIIFLTLNYFLYFYLNFNLFRYNILQIYYYLKFSLKQQVKYSVYLIFQELLL